MKQKIVAVNATSLNSGGGLTILNEFIAHINEGTSSTSPDPIYYIFVSDPLRCVSTNKQSVHLIQAPHATMLQKIYWEWFGLKNWFKKRSLIPAAVLSLQNTSINIPKQSNLLIYLHQGLCLHPQNWSFFKANQRLFAFYKYIYPLFIFMHARKNTQFIVQSQWMKQALCSRFKRQDAQVHVIKPTMQAIEIDRIETKPLHAQYNLFYPATAFSFKNHQEIIYALDAMRANGENLSDYAVYFTINEREAPDLMTLINQLNLRENIHFLGPLSYHDVLIYYKSCSAVLFPSYLESFGLPLLEAALFGKPLVGLDADYVREVIGGYAGVRLAKRNDPKAWAQAIVQAVQLGDNLKPYHPQYESGWDTVFGLLTRDCI